MRRGCTARDENPLRRGPPLVPGGTRSKWRDVESTTCRGLSRVSSAKTTSGAMQPASPVCIRDAALREPNANRTYLRNSIRWLTAGESVSPGILHSRIRFSSHLGSQFFFLLTFCPLWLTPEPVVHPGHPRTLSPTIPTFSRRSRSPRGICGEHAGETRRAPFLHLPPDFSARRRTPPRG